jgi:hypothetical protein
MLGRKSFGMIASISCLLLAVQSAEKVSVSDVVLAVVNPLIKQVNLVNSFEGVREASTGIESEKILSFLTILELSKLMNKFALVAPAVLGSCVILTCEID